MLDITACLHKDSTHCVGQTDLSQLEDVFLAVNDFEAATGQPGADISSVQPPILVQHLLGLLLILEVPLEDRGAPHTNLHRACSLLTATMRIHVQAGAGLVCIQPNVYIAYANAGETCC